MRIVARTVDQARKAAAEIDRQVQRGPIMITVEPYRPPRTDRQNAKLHAMLSELADAIGYSAAELKEWVLAEYGPTRTLELCDRTVTVPKRTSDYSREEAATLIEHLYRIGAECGVTLR